MFLALLIAVAILDARKHVIPNRITGVLCLAGYACALLYPGWEVLLSEVLISSGATLALGLIAYRFGMGGGDVKIFVAVAAMWGYQVVQVVVLTFLIGGAYVLVQLVRKRLTLQEKVPLAPSIATAVMLVMMLH